MLSNIIKFRVIFKLSSIYGWHKFLTLPLLLPKAKELVSKIFALAVVALFSSCTTVKVKNLNSSICSGKQPTQKFIWTISFSQRVPRGMELSKVSEFVRNRSELQDNVTQSFVAGLIYLSSNSGQYSFLSRSQTNYPLNYQASYIAEERNTALVETGSSNFLFCKSDECEGLKDPQTRSVVQKYFDEDFVKRAGSAVRPMYYVKGIVDPSDYKFNDHKASSFSFPSPAYIEWNDYFERHPFAGGDLLSQNYFIIPESRQSELCMQAGYEKNCFDPPRYDFKNDIITFMTCNINSEGCFSEFQKLAPFRFQFLSDNNGMCGTNCLDDINSMLSKLKTDPYFRLQWKDAVSKDIFLKLSTSTSRKVEKDWIITRFEWNPTLFCQYAHPNSDLISH